MTRFEPDTKMMVNGIRCFSTRFQDGYGTKTTVCHCRFYTWYENGHEFQNGGLHCFGKQFF